MKPVKRLFGNGQLLSEKIKIRKIKKETKILLPKNKTVYLI
jgi:hypothetical protein